MGVSLRSTSGPTIERAGDLAAVLTNREEGDLLFEWDPYTNPILTDVPGRIRFEQVTYRYGEEGRGEGHGDVRRVRRDAVLARAYAAHACGSVYVALTSRSLVKLASSIR